jgi:hypothetical protein
MIARHRNRAAGETVPSQPRTLAGAPTAGPAAKRDDHPCSVGPIVPARPNGLHSPVRIPLRHSRLCVGWLPAEWAGSLGVLLRLNGDCVRRH